MSEEQERVEGALILAREAQLSWHVMPEALKQEVVSNLRRALRDKDGWPKVYVNAETGRVYQPHNELERSMVFSDTPRYALIRGGEGCVAAETVVDGVPIAERKTSSLTTTVAGRFPASAGYRKGQADLYRVRVQSGAEVTVTLQHRFLTPLGWHRLVDLSVGDRLAAHGRLSDRLESERESGSLGGYHAGSHSGDGSPSPLAAVVRDRWQQLHRTGGGSSALLSSFPCHSCRSGCGCPWVQTHPLDGEQRHKSEGADEYARVTGRMFPRSDHRFLHQDSDALCSPSAGKSCLDGFWDSECRTCPIVPVSHTCAMSQSAQPPCPCHGTHSRDPRNAGVQTFSGEYPCRCRYRCDEAPWKHGTENSPASWRSPSDDLAADRLLLCLRRLESYPPHDSTYWTEVQDIRFVKHGDFYDLSVPFWEHYVANGLVHHNSGKTTAGVVKTLNRLHNGMSGLLISPNLPHLKRSVWPEFRRWCPWDQVVKKHRRFGQLDWEPHEPFNIVFTNKAVLHCTGIENPGSLEGPNINFAHFDEARHHPDEKALKVLDGRVRIPGPKGEPPQIWLTTTPAMHWLYTYFGPVVEDDPFAAFKADARDIVLLTIDNEPNLFEGFAQARAQTLTEREARVLLEAAWEDLSEGQPFLPDITWWDHCQEELPPLGQRESLVLALDAATGRMATSSDCFAIVGTTRHPDGQRAEDSVAVRYSKMWQAKAGEKIDYRGTVLDPGPERELLRLCGYDMDESGVLTYRPDGGYNVTCVVYDPTELHDMAARLAGVAWFEEFSQSSLRNKSDRQLLELIQQRRVAHGGNEEMRKHIYNADRKTDESGHKLRIVKRVDSLKIDLAVALSMASYQTLFLNL